MAASEKTQTHVPIDPRVLQSDFANTKAEKPLRICCYGSHSSATPEKYLAEARSLGYILARRGHTCVNGGGSFGCMAAMNDAAEFGNGHIVGVIHKMFIVDGSDWAELNRDGGAHRVFEKKSKPGGPIREMLVAGGKDLQERKRLLVEKADALIVLPGGPGTWDELWEMGCARNVGLTDLPIVCVNVDGYYDPFRQILERASKDKLIKHDPEKILHFEATAEEAIRWVENRDHPGSPPAPTVVKRTAALTKSSFYSPPTLDRFNTIVGDTLKETGAHEETQTFNFWHTSKMAFVFVSGLALGVSIAVNAGRPSPSNK